MKSWKEIIEKFKHPQLGVIKRVSLKSETGKWFAKHVDDQDRVLDKIAGPFKNRNEAKKWAESKDIEVVPF